MSNNKGWVYINIRETSDKVVYTNRAAHKNSKGGKYINGIHRALWEEFGDAIFWETDPNGEGQFSQVVKDVLGYNITERAEYTGIGAQITAELAEEIAERATKYCPEETGNLKNSIKVIYNNDGTAYILYACTYAWFVHEFVWRSINRDVNPFAIHKWLDVAIQEVYKEHGLL